jgi:hypothetical protein
VLKTPHWARLIASSFPRSQYANPCHGGGPQRWGTTNAYGDGKHAGFKAEFQSGKRGQILLCHSFKATPGRTRPSTFSMKKLPLTHSLKITSYEVA